ncbi:MAG: hypothetical protein CMJ32_10045 [Phycisphaerae bacterium]|nr:hypothetical protein [Phycisphaerae bacterium]
MSCQEHGLKVAWRQWLLFTSIASSQDRAKVVGRGHVVSSFLLSRLHGPAIGSSWTRKRTDPFRIQSPSHELDRTIDLYRHVADEKALDGRTLPDDLAEADGLEVNTLLLQQPLITGPLAIEPERADVTIENLPVLEHKVCINIGQCRARLDDQWNHEDAAPDGQGLDETSEDTTTILFRLRLLGLLTMNRGCRDGARESENQESCLEHGLNPGDRMANGRSSSVPFRRTDFQPWR